jgi:hypothetical protein
MRASSCHCPCCADTAHQQELIPGVTRRQFLYNIGAARVGGLAFSTLDLNAAMDAALPKRRPLVRQTLTVQPVLTYATPQKREATSWRSWGGIQSEEEAKVEAARIEGELAKMKQDADFSIQIRPVQLLKSVEPARNIAQGDHDVMLIYGAGGGGNLLDALTVNYISNLPVFLNDPTLPHDHTVTLAHCTAPRKMDGKRLEPVKILTHFESDYGAAPKVEMKLGQVCTNLVPDFASKKWVGFAGQIIGNSVGSKGSCGLLEFYHREVA